MATVFEGSLNDQQAQLFKVIFVRLAAAVGASQALVSVLEPAAPGSRNAQTRAEQTRDAFELVGLLQYSGEDHLRTMLMVFEGRQLPTYGLFTLLRAAAEAIVRCAYLLDPGITERRRLARALNVRLANLIEQNKAAPDDALHSERVAYLVQRAAENDIEVFNSKKNLITHFGEPRKSEVDLFAEYVKPLEQSSETQSPVGSMVYRYLSGQVHSMLWVMLSETESVSTEEPGMSSVKLDLKFDWLAAMLSLVLRVHEQNMLHLLELSGHPTTRWDEAKRMATIDAQARYVRLAEEQAKREAHANALNSPASKLDKR